LFSREFSDPEGQIMEILHAEGRVSIDRLSLECNIPLGKIAELLLDLELEGLIRCLPGDVYCMDR
jgi:DNA processing protein